MSAKHALLGLLRQGPAYPYQLMDRLEALLGPAWSVDEGQIYKTIKQLADNDLIEPAGGAREDRTERRHFYAITDSGGEEWDRWYGATQPVVRLPRRPLLLKITLAGGPERLKVALTQVNDYELECTKLLQEVMHARDEIPREGLHVRADHLLLRVNLGADINHLEGELKWARDARDVISRLLSQKAIWPSIRERSADPDEDHNRQGARKELFDQMAASHLRPQVDEKTD